MPVTCPNCNAQYDDKPNKSKCPNCAVDPVLYAGTVQISNTLYNEGLAFAKVSNLTGALDCLSRSVYYNKKNTAARNLLGLVQYEMGQTGAALKNWVISCGFQREENPASKYISSFQKNARALERLNDSIRLYNQSLKDLASKSDDMAMIKLKQALEINPKFIDALNLLTLCYLIQGDKAKASATAERVLAIDMGNAIALNYYNEINPSSNPAASRRAKMKKAPAEAPAKPYKKVTLHERNTVNFHLAEILCLIIGALCTLGVMYVLVFPALDRTREAQTEEALARLSQAEQAHSLMISEKEQQISSLEEQSEQYAERIQYWEDRYDTLERTFQVLTARELLRENRYREAVDALGTIETAGLAPDIADLANQVRTVSYPILARQYYNEGVPVYNAQDFEGARVLFERAYRYVQHTEDRALHGEVLYYLAYTFFRLSDYDRAIEYFERLLEEFPNHNRTWPARNRLNAITP